MSEINLIDCYNTDSAKPDFEKSKAVALPAMVL